MSAFNTGQPSGHGLNANKHATCNSSIPLHESALQGYDGRRNRYTLLKVKYIEMVHADFSYLSIDKQNIQIKSLGRVTPFSSLKSEASQK